MSENKMVDLKVSEELFYGLSKQNLYFHQCVMGLCDNAIAAKEKDKPFLIHILLDATECEEDYVEVYISDNGKGMNFNTLQMALQLGKSATVESRLNEHGWGLKTALVSLSGNNGMWDLWTKDRGTNKLLHVQGPFKPFMDIEIDGDMPENNFLPLEWTTLIKVKVKLDYMQTVQGRGAKPKDLLILREWLIEHLGVVYRGYLSSNTVKKEGSIYILTPEDSIRVLPIEIPMTAYGTEEFEVTIKGKTVRICYMEGMLDVEKRKKALVYYKNGMLIVKPLRHYYSGNRSTQGVDIRVGNRVIATGQFETIWKIDDSGEDGEVYTRPLERNRNYNRFVGEVMIPELERGLLSTTVDKTSFSFDDSNWERIFTEIRKKHPEKNIEAIAKKAYMGTTTSWHRIVNSIRSRGADNEDDFAEDDSEE